MLPSYYEQNRAFQPDRFRKMNPIDFPHRYSFYFLQKKLTQNHLLPYKNHQYQHTSGDPTVQHTHRTRAQPNLSK